MKTKSVFTLLLLGFVAVSIAMAFQKISPESKLGDAQTLTEQTASGEAAPADLSSKLTESQFSAVYFHSPHRCPTCRTIESFTHAALTPEIEAGKIAWQTADYTSDNNAEQVDQFKVFTSTVVLVEVQDGKVVRWKNLEEVWDHTNDQAKFTNFINQAWSEFNAS